MGRGGIDGRGVAVLCVCWLGIALDRGQDIKVLVKLECLD
jgi:hypothetical protein